MVNKKASVLGDVTNKNVKKPSKSKNTKPTTSKGNVTKKEPSTSKKTAAKKKVLKNAHLMSNSEKLLATCRFRCKNMIKEYGPGCDWILDDTSTFSYCSNLAGMMFNSYWAREGDPPRYNNKNDSIDRLRVWICFSSAGLAKVHIMDVQDNYDQHVYLEECVKAKMIPFIEANHKKKKTVIWSNASTAHQGKTVTNYLDTKNINYIPKEDNPGSRVRCPLYFWSKLKMAVYKDNWIAKNKDDLFQRIKRCLAKIEISKVAEIAADSYARINEMANHGEILTNNDTKKYYSRY